MTLAKDTLLVEQVGKLIAFPMAAQKVYQGALVVISAAGYASNAVVEAGSNFAGIAYEQKDNSAGAAGDLSLKVETEGVFELPIAAAVIGDVGSLVYASANDIVTLTEGTDKKPKVGKIVKVISATKVAVKLESFTGTGA
jgi:predicted RecA/RadA family phage recombinase